VCRVHQFGKRIAEVPSRRNRAAGRKCLDGGALFDARPATSSGIPSPLAWSIGRRGGRGQASPNESAAACELSNQVRCRCLPTGQPSSTATTFEERRLGKGRRLGRGRRSPSRICGYDSLVCPRQLNADELLSMRWRSSSSPSRLDWRSSRFFPPAPTRPTSRVGSTLSASSRKVAIPTT